MIKIVKMPIYRYTVWRLQEHTHTHTGLEPRSESEEVESSDGPDC